MIGDEVMFVVDRRRRSGARSASSLAEAYADDELLSDVRVGLASVRCSCSDGDYFGPTVNLAHRIVNIGNPARCSCRTSSVTALVVEAADEFDRAAAAAPAAEGPRPRAAVEGAGAAGARPRHRRRRDRRRNVRWERLGEVLRDLEELRERRRAACVGADGAPTGSAVVEPGGGDAVGP